MNKARQLLATNLRRLRTEAHLNQADLAELADLSTNMIQKIEYGKTSPTPETLDKLCKALKCSLPELYGGQVKEFSKTDLTPDLMAEVLRWLLQAAAPQRAVALFLLSKDESFLAGFPERNAQNLLKWLKAL